MIPTPPPAPVPAHARRRPGRSARVLSVVAIGVVVVVAGFGVYAYLSDRGNGLPTLTIYTYSSLFGGSCGSPVWPSVFDAFGRAHHVHVQVECPGGNLESTLESQRNAPGADLVIGLDEITSTQAASRGLLVPYASPQLAHIPSSLTDELVANHEATPYEYGYLAIDYTPQFAGSTGGRVANSSFPDFAANSTWASNLLVEDPTTDITGEELLVWQIEFYQQVLHQDWKGFWSSADPHLVVAPDWGTAFGEFNTSATSPQMVVSYTTDPAYAVNSGAPGSLNATVSTWGGQEYGWKTIYGLGIVNGTRHLALDQQFVDWFLNGSVQSQVPTNEWEYPANSTVPLPPVFGSALDPGRIHALNDGTTPEAIVQNLTAPQNNWLDEWQALENQYG